MSERRDLRAMAWAERVCVEAQVGERERGEREERGREGHAELGGLESESDRHPRAHCEGPWRCR